MTDNEHALDEHVATPEQWETDPFGVAATIITNAVNIAISYNDAMSTYEYDTLVNVRKLVS